MSGVQTTTLGRTGLAVTPVGLGLAALGRPAYINLGRDRHLGPRRSVEDMERRSHVVLDAAYRGGVRYFDVARSYGYAERFLASWLESRALGPRRITVASKWGYTYVGDWRLDADVHEVKDHSLAALQHQYAESTELLGDHLCLYQIHSATVETGVLEDAAVLSELCAIAETGVAIGLSLSGPNQVNALRIALDTEIGGANPFSCVQATFNLLEPSVREALEEAHAEGWGVIVKEALANGRLAPHNDDPSFIAKRAILDAIAGHHGVTTDALALSWVVSQDFVDVALSGAVTTEQLESNLAALQVELSPEDLSALGDLTEAPEAYWAARKTLGWS
jgi:aryl-alcohol dehydrogenase-like predicted oxidoreductase